MGHSEEFVSPHHKAFSLHLYLAASCAITRYLSFFHNSLSVASLTHFALPLMSTPHLLSSFWSSGSARCELKTSLSWYWRGFATTHLLVLSPSFSIKSLLACLSICSLIPPSFSVEVTLFAPCSCSHQHTTLAYLDSLNALSCGLD